MLISAKTFNFLSLVAPLGSNWRSVSGGSHLTGVRHNALF